MKGLSTLITFQALLSTISGTMIANMSFVGKMGILFMHREYSVLRTWWKTALLLFGVQLLVIFLLWLTRRILPRPLAVGFTLVLLIGGGYAAYLTYLDFTGTSHRLMKTEFHIGGYLVWVGWAISCFYFLFAGLRKKPIAKTVHEHSNQKTITEP